MNRVLHIDASPRGEQSHSARAAAGFIACLRERQPALATDRMAVWDEYLPEFDGAALSAKYARLAGRDHDGEEAGAWRGIAQLVERLARADSILVSTPMWNLSIPYRLKHLIDLVTQPGLTFAFDPAKGYTPLLAPRPVLVIIASSGDFSGGDSWGRRDLATPYLRHALAFMGLRDTRFVAVAPTAGHPDGVRQGAHAAHVALEGEAAWFLGAAA